MRFSYNVVALAVLHGCRRGGDILVKEYFTPKLLQGNRYKLMQEGCAACGRQA